MRLLQLNLTNFQGIKEFTLRPMGRPVCVYGPNGSGKSTIASALSWLLTGKSASGEKGYSPKPLDENGDEIHHINTSAEAVFEINPGEEFIISKEISEKWVKKTSKESDEEAYEYKGNVTKFYINGDAVSEQKYMEAIAAYVSPSESMILTIPSYFAEELPWAERRKMLISVCGDVTEDETIAVSPEFNEIPGIIAETGMPGASEALCTLRKKTAELEEHLKDIPIRIEAVTEMMEKLPAESKLSALEAEKNNLEERRNELTQKLGTMDSTLSDSENRKRLADTEAEFAEKKAAYLRKCNEINKDAEERISGINSRLTEIRTELKAIKESIDADKKQLEALKKSKDEHLAEYNRLKNLKAETEKLEMNPDDCICPYCKQPLPEIQQEDKRQRFLADKDNRLAEISRKMDAVISQGQEEKKRIEGIEAKLTAEESEISPLESKEKILAEELSSVAITTFPPFQSTDEAKDLIAKAERIREAIRNSSSSMSEAANALRKDIADAENKIQEIIKEIGSIDLRREYLEKIDELGKDRRTTALAIGDANRKTQLLTLFIRKKAELLDKKISGRFNGVRFRLTENLINGTTRECCEPLVRSASGWIPYTQASNAEKIKGGLEIIRMLADNLRKEMPVMIDNAESVIDYGEERGMQLIRLYVKDTMTGSLEVL